MSVSSAILRGSPPYPSTIRCIGTSLSFIVATSLIFANHTYPYLSRFIGKSLPSWAAPKDSFYTFFSLSWSGPQSPPSPALATLGHPLPGGRGLHRPLPLPLGEGWG